MCGLYSLRKSPQETRALFEYAEEPDFPPRQHVAPGQPIAIVRWQEGKRRFALVRWGFIPSWMKEVKPGRPMINARGETVMEKQTFRNAMRRRRCLIPADGFYEWLGDVPGRKIPYLAERRDQSLFAFAGLWEHWLGADGSELETALILTVSPNSEISEVGDRMPVIVARDDFQTWLDGDERDAVKLIVPAPDGTFTLTPAALSRNTPPSKPEPPKPDQLSLF
jgi:putative SOS response-associated peptidase YedK